MKKLTRLLAFLLAAALLLGGVPASAAFSDVGDVSWYKNSIDKLVSMGIIEGYPDGSFRPQGVLTRGAFLTLVAKSMFLEFVGDPVSPHWAACYLDAAVDLDVVSYDDIPKTKASLDAEITRYEMAMMIIRTLRVLYDKGWSDTTGIDTEITDYADVPDRYREYVGQAYRLGLISGYEDGSFIGTRSLNRGEASVVITRMLDMVLKIEEDSMSVRPENPGITLPDGYTPVADRPKAEFNLAVFGNQNVTWHPSYEDAQARWTTVQVNVWRLRSDGTKYADTVTLTVNKGVAEVKGIFQLIFEGDEKFPIRTLHTVRKNTSDTRSEHMWGVAIDINANENYYCYKDSGKAIVGSHWQPGIDPYSIPRNGDVTNAFAAYGWGWGGDGTWSRTQDYMHFSVTGT